MAQYLAVIGLSSLDGNNGFEIVGEAGGDSCGRSVSSGDVNGDGYTDLIVGSYHADPHGSASGASYVIFGKASSFGASFDLGSIDGNNGFQLNGEAAGDFSGRSVSSAGDVNNDGFDDVIVGARDASPTAARSGASYVVFGKASGFAGAIDLSSLDGNNGFKINGEAMYDVSGNAVSSAGDLNGDGFADLIVGAYGVGGSETGASYVVFGKASGFGAALNLSALDGNNGFQINGEAAYDYSGVSVSSAGDVNGDGFDDLIVGAYYADPHGNTSGASYVVFGKASSFGTDLSLSTLDGNNGFQINGEAAYDNSGRSVASAGDVNADGFADLIVGAPGAGPNGYSSGASYVVFGTDAGFGATFELSSLDGNNGFQLNGETAYDKSGFSVSSAGDFNGDGFADVIVGARDADTNLTGASYVVFGKASGFGATLNLSALDGNNGFKITGEATFDNSGMAVSSAGDVNGDGFADLIVGSPGTDAHGGSTGSSYVIYGSVPGEAVTRSGTDIANAIHGGDFDDTLNGLGGKDTLYGHKGHDLLNGGGGKDKLTGGGGADDLDGGSGADRFIYRKASESTGLSYDTVKNADFSQDVFDTKETVSGIDATIASGQLRGGHFNVDLATAVDAAHLGADHAVLFTPDQGNQAGKTFLIVDQNGTAGYQAGADLVIELKTPVNLASIDTGDFI